MTHTVPAINLLNIPGRTLDEVQEIGTRSILASLSTYPKAMLQHIFTQRNSLYKEQWSHISSSELLATEGSSSYSPILKDMDIASEEGVDYLTSADMPDWVKDSTQEVIRAINFFEGGPSDAVRGFRDVIYPEEYRRFRSINIPVDRLVELEKEIWATKSNWDILNSCLTLTPSNIFHTPHQSNHADMYGGKSLVSINPAFKFPVCNTGGITHSAGGDLSKTRFRERLLLLPITPILPVGENKALDAFNPCIFRVLWMQAIVTPDFTTTSGAGYVPIPPLSQITVPDEVDLDTVIYPLNEYVIGYQPSNRYLVEYLDLFRRTRKMLGHPLRAESIIFPDMPCVWYKDSREVNARSIIAPKGLGRNEYPQIGCSSGYPLQQKIF